MINLGYHVAANVGHNNITEMTESLENLAATALQEQNTMTALTDAMAKLTSKLETKDAEIRRLKIATIQMEKNRRNNTPQTEAEARPDRGVWEFNTNYCWTHGWHITKDHNRKKCKAKKPGHMDAATRANTYGGSYKNNYRALALAP